MKKNLIRTAALAAAIAIAAATGAKAETTRTVEGTVIHARGTLAWVGDADGVVTTIRKFACAMPGRRVILKKDDAGNVIDYVEPKVYVCTGKVLLNVNGDLFVQVGDGYYPCYGESPTLPVGSEGVVQVCDNCTPEDTSDDTVDRFVMVYPAESGADLF